MYTHTDLEIEPNPAKRKTFCPTTIIKETSLIPNGTLQNRFLSSTSDEKVAVPRGQLEVLITKSLEGGFLSNASQPERLYNEIASLKSGGTQQ